VVSPDALDEVKIKMEKFGEDLIEIGEVIES
jgi:hypothetical protein